MTAFDELRRTGELERLDDGRLIVQGRPLAVLRWLDGQFEAMATADGAEPMQVPALIARDVLARAGYFESFGERATTVAGGGPSPAHAHALTPALCYHAYARLAGQRLDSPVMWTTVGRCYRAEPDASSSPARLWEFTMREVIVIGPGAWVVDERRRWMERLSMFAADLGLTATLALATDPFFVSASKGRQLMQQLKELKYELRTPAGPERADVAVASMNLHETFFGSRFGLTLADGSAASSGCVAFGLERWMLAIVAQLGIDRADALAVEPAGRAERVRRAAASGERP